MVEYTNIQDNSEEIMKCIVDCETPESIVAKKEQIEPDNIANKEEYIDEP